MAEMEVQNSAGQLIVSGDRVEALYPGDGRIEWWSSKGAMLAYADKTGFHMIGSVRSCDEVHPEASVFHPEGHRMDVPGLGGVPLPCYPDEP